MMSNDLVKELRFDPKANALMMQADRIEDLESRAEKAESEVLQLRDALIHIKIMSPKNYFSAREALLGEAAKRIEALEARTEKAEAARDALRDALIHINSMRPEHYFSGEALRVADSALNEYDT